MYMYMYIYICLYMCIYTYMCIYCAYIHLYVYSHLCAFWCVLYGTIYEMIFVIWATQLLSGMNIMFAVQFFLHCRQCVAVWCSAFCSVVQCGAVWCSVVQCGVVWCSVLQYATVCCSVFCIVVLCAAVCCIMFQCVAALEARPVSLSWSFSQKDMGWLRLVGSLKLLVSFAKEPRKRDYILQKRPRILRILLIAATP